MAEPQGRALAARDDSPEQRARETAWLQQIAQQGPQGSQALYQLTCAYSRKMLSFFMRQRMSREDAEDLVQNVWVRVVGHAAEFDPAHKPSTWIWAIARHLLIDEVRRPFRHREHAHGDDLEQTLIANHVGEAPNCALPGESVDDCVHRGLRSYARTDKEGAWAVQVRDLEDWDIADLAHFLERTEGATRTFLSQVRKKLAPFLKPCFELLSN
jgi:RNA polymerase sigma factor (sigma-70 family)